MNDSQLLAIVAAILALKDDSRDSVTAACYAHSYVTSADRFLYEAKRATAERALLCGGAEQAAKLKNEKQ